MGAYAVLLFAKLGTRVDVILRENFRSVLAGQQMKEASERMDSGLFFRSSGKRSVAAISTRKTFLSSSEGLRIESDNITLPGEDKLVAELRHSHDAYTARAEAFWHGRRSRKAANDVFQRTSSALHADQGHRAGDHFHQSGCYGEGRSRRSRAECAVHPSHGRCQPPSALGWRSTSPCAMQRSILQPIQALTAVSKELGEGSSTKLCRWNPRMSSASWPTPSTRWPRG